MAHRRATIGDGLFWGATGALFAAIMGGAIGFVFARFYGAGWISGGALGVLIFLIASLILARSAANLPPPNTLKAPLAPAGGAFLAPPGGAFQAPDAPPPSERAHFQPRREETTRTDTGPQSLADVSHAAGEAVGKAAFSASAAVTSAAQAAKAAIADVLEPTKPSAAQSEAGAGSSANTTAEPTPLADTIPPERRVQPEALPGPREGGPDDLKRIRGVGPKLEEMLNGKGFYHFDQIAVWAPAEIAWVDANIEGFYGRATRDDWVGQAKLLASGGETDFSRRVDKGEVY